MASIKVMGHGIHFGFGTVAAIAGYALATMSAVMLYRRARHARVKFISVVVGLVPLYQAGRLIKEASGLGTMGSEPVVQMADLAAAAMMLCCVLALKRESSRLGLIEERLRLAEGAAGWWTHGGKDSEAARRVKAAKAAPRRCLLCDKTVRGYRKWFGHSPFCSDEHRDAFLTDHALPRLTRTAAEASGDEQVVIG